MNGTRNPRNRMACALLLAVVAPAMLSACVWTNHRRSYAYSPTYGPHTPPPGYADDRAAGDQAVPAAPDGTGGTGENGDASRRVPITYEQGIRAGYLLLDGGNFGEAVAAFQDAIYSDPQRADGWYHLACAYSRWSWADDDGTGATGRPSPDRLRRAALVSLDQAVARGWSDLPHMAQDPDMGPLRDLPEYRAICMQIHRNLGHQAYIGISGDSMEDHSGFLVTSIGHGSAATRPTPGDPISERDPDADRRLLPGDLIVAVDLTPVHDHDTLSAALAQKSPGDACSITVRRDGRFVVIPLLLGARPQRLGGPMPTRVPAVTDTPEIVVVDAGNGQVVVNRGHRHGLEPGMVLTVTRSDVVIAQVEIVDAQDLRATGFVMDRDRLDASLRAGDAVRPALPPDRRIINDRIRARAESEQPAPADPEPGDPVPYPVPGPDDLQPTDPEPAPAPGVEQPKPSPAPDDAVTAKPEPEPEPRPTRVVTAADVLSMQKAGLSDTTIISVIRASHVKVDEQDVQPMLEELARAGASAAVLDALCGQLAAQKR